MLGINILLLAFFSNLFLTIVQGTFALQPFFICYSGFGYQIRFLWSFSPGNQTHNAQRRMRSFELFYISALLILLYTFRKQAQGFYVCAAQAFWKHCGKKEQFLAISNFFFSHSVFYPFGELSVIFIELKIVVCKLFQFGRVKFVVWKGLSFNDQMSLEVITLRPFDKQKSYWFRKKFDQITLCGLRRVFLAETVCRCIQDPFQLHLDLHEIEIYFCCVCRRKCHYEFNRVIWKSCIEANPIKMKFSLTNKYFDSTQIYQTAERTGVALVKGTNVRN